MIPGLRKTFERGSRGEGFDLPAGKECGDCAFYPRCAWLIGQMASDAVCDWNPSKFTERGTGLSDRHQAGSLVSSPDGRGK